MTRFLFALILGFLLTACQQVTVDETEFVPKKLTELRVGTLYGPQIYMTSGQGDSGFDYDMAVLFAEYLNVPLKMVPYTNRIELYEALKKNEIDIIAAGMTETPTRREQFRLGPPLYRVNQVLVYREGMPTPKDISDLKGKITVIADSSFVETLTQLQKHYPTLVWDQITDKDSEELLAMIANKEIDYTIADSSSVQINRRYLPDLVSDNRQRREMAERMALNAPIQGSAADIIKRAMVTVDNWLSESGLDAKVILQVHDELVLEVREDLVEQVSEQIKPLMGNAAALDVPLLVEVGVGDNWDEAH